MLEEGAEKDRPYHRMSREEIRAVYAQGVAAVIDLVEQLQARLAAQEEQLQAQQTLLASLASRVKELEDRLPKIATTAASPRPAMGSRRGPRVCGPRAVGPRGDKRDILDIRCAR